MDVSVNKNISGEQLGARLRMLRAALDLTQADLAQLCGVSPNTVSRWESDENPIPKLLLNVLQIYGVNRGWLLAGKGELFRSPKEEVEKTIRGMLSDEEAALRNALVAPMKAAGLAGIASQEEIDFARQFEGIRVLGVRLGAGNKTVELGLEPELGRLAFRRDWLQREIGATDPEKDLAIVNAEGDSMSPTIEDGDALLVDLRAKTVKRAGIYAIRAKDLLMVKRIDPQPDGACKIISDNPRYEPWTMEPPQPEDQRRDFEVAGRVVWIGRRV